MAYDGLGNYVRIHNWTQDAANGLDINAGEMDAEDNSIAGAFNNTVTRDNQGKPSANFCAAADLTYSLGTGGLRWSGINGVPIAQYLTQGNFGTFTNSRTQAEVTAGVTTTFYAYSASPKVDPRRYGAVGNGTTNDQAALQTAINVALASKGTVELPEGYQFAITSPLSVTITGTDSLNCSFAMVGQGQCSSQIIMPAGSAINALNIQSSAPNTLLQPAQIVLEGFGITNYPNAVEGTGIYLQGIGWARISNVQVRNFINGIAAINSLELLIDDQCQLINNTVGFVSGREGTFLSSNIQTNNYITLRNNRITGNTSWGVNHGGGSLLLLDNNDIEGNGTSGNFATGAIQTAGDLAGTFGLAKVEMRSNWIEGNLGTSVLINPLSSGSLFFDMDGGHIISAQSGAALSVCAGGAAASVSNIKNVYSPSPGDTWQINAVNSNIVGGEVNVLTDVSTYRNYLGVITGAGNNPGFGVEGSFTVTLTGVTGTITATAKYVIMGKVVTLAIPAIAGTSNSNAMSLTGFPAAVQPATAEAFVGNVQDGSNLGVPAQCYLSGGTMTMNGPLAGNTFTTSGTKGLLLLNCSYLLS